eukprot:3931908-Rhodomonas_salina.1
MGPGQTKLDPSNLAYTPIELPLHSDLVQYDRKPQIQSRLWRWGGGEVGAFYVCECVSDLSVCHRVTVSPCHRVTVIVTGT